MPSLAHKRPEDSHGAGHWVQAFGFWLRDGKGPNQFQVGGLCVPNAVAYTGLHGSVRIRKEPKSHVP